MWFEMSSKARRQLGRGPTQRVKTEVIGVKLDWLIEITIPLATAAPIPAEAPVTRQTLPSHLSITAGSAWFQLSVLKTQRYSNLLQPQTGWWSKYCRNYLKYKPAMFYYTIAITIMLSLVCISYLLKISFISFQFSKAVMQYRLNFNHRNKYE